MAAAVMRAAWLRPAVRPCMLLCVLCAVALLVQNALRAPALNVAAHRVWHTRRVASAVPWAHDWALFDALDAKFSATCGPVLAAAVKKARGDAASTALHCVGGKDDIGRYCFAETVCVSRSGISVRVDTTEAVTGPSLRMHGGFSGYCGVQNWTVPLETERSTDSMFTRQIDHGPLVVGELCESTHYAHGIGTNMYPLFLQALRIGAAAHASQRGGSNGMPTLHGVSFAANSMYGSVASPFGHKLMGMPLQGMLEPIFINGAPEQFFVPNFVDPERNVVHCYSPAIIGLRNTCPLPPIVCSHGVTTAEHCLYQMYVSMDAEAEVLPGSAEAVVYGPAEVSSPGSLPTMGPPDDPRYAAPLLVIVQRRTSRVVENMDDVVAMLHGFHDRLKAAICSLKPLQQRPVASAVTPVYDQTVLTKAEMGDVSGLTPEADVERIAALLGITDADCESGAMWKYSLLRWRVVSLEGMSVRQQVRLFSRANLLVSACGNSNTNMLWMPLGSSFIQVCPRGVIDTYWDAMIPMTRIRHTAMMCTGEHCMPHPELAMLENPKQRNITISVEALYSVLLRELVALYAQAQQLRDGSGEYATMHDDILAAWTPECL